MSCIVILVVGILVLAKTACSDSDELSFYGSLKLEGVEEIDANGLVTQTNSTMQQQGYAFFQSPFRFKNSTSGSVSSFSTTLVFAVVSSNSSATQDGRLAFIISPSKAVSNDDIEIVLNSLLASQYEYFKSEKVVNGNRMQAWVEYDSSEKRVNITLYPVDRPKPDLTLTLSQDVSAHMYEDMYVGFSSFMGTSLASFYILAWNFKMNGKAEEIDQSRLPKLPELSSGSGGYGRIQKILAVTLSLTGATFVSVLIFGTIWVIRKRRPREVLEDWEVEYGPHKFTYKELFKATKGFKDKELLGKGGFGRVYRGLIQASSTQIAVKMVSHDSSQGMREFVAEIATIGRLRHPNLVRLLGYCRRKQELFLVYDYMPNGSLDKFLYRQPAQKYILTWGMRYKIIQDVAAALFYLHQQWLQVVIHRDIKPSNVLIDDQMNARLGDFGLAKLVDHGTDPQPSILAGTLGYIAPELARTGKASTSTDVFAFGVFLLEVVCGRRPVDSRATVDKALLTEWVLDCWEREVILEAVDARLGDEYVAEEAELVLKLGLFCSHVVPAERPSMSDVVQYLNGVSTLPGNLRDTIRRYDNVGNAVGVHAANFMAPEIASSSSLTISDSLLCEGR